MKKQLLSVLSTVLIVLGAFSVVNATTFRFDTDPFEGTTALTTPGRQVVGNESFISFDIASDIFSLESTVFDAGNQVLFANNVVGNLPTSDVNVIVLQTFDNDSNPLTAFGAGNAADLIAGRGRAFSFTSTVDSTCLA